MKKPKYQGEFKDTRGGDVSFYHPWSLVQSKNDEKTRLEWVKKIISLIKEQGKDNPSKKKLAAYLQNSKASHIIGFIPYVEYFKHKTEGAMTIDAAYVHAFGSPALLVYDKSSCSLLIVGPSIDFNSENGIKG